jgi:hypothetical protein
MSAKRSFPWIPFILLVLVVATIAAIRYLPWWGVALYFAVLVLGWKYIAAAIFTLMVRNVARDMARALLGARVDVHSLRAVPPPDASVLAELDEEDEEDEEDEDAKEFAESIKDMPDEPPEARDWYELEATITPRDVEPDDDGNRPDWQPSSLILVVPGGAWGEYDLACRVARVEMERQGSFQPAGKLITVGATRLRLLLGAQPGTTRLVFRYFTENFGDIIELPPPVERPARSST